MDKNNVANHADMFCRSEESLPTTALYMPRFSVGCKKAGYVGNATRLWAAINDDAFRN